jgi:hypothetical protein
VLATQVFVLAMSLSPLDRKLINAFLKEMRYAFASRVRTAHPETWAGSEGEHCRPNRQTVLRFVGLRSCELRARLPVSIFSPATCTLGPSRF